VCGQRMKNSNKHLQVGDIILKIKAMKTLVLIILLI